MEEKRKKYYVISSPPPPKTKTGFQFSCFWIQPINIQFIHSGLFNTELYSNEWEASICNLLSSPLLGISNIHLSLPLGIPEVVLPAPALLCDCSERWEHVLLSLTSSSRQQVPPKAATHSFPVVMFFTVFSQTMAITLAYLRIKDYYL